MAGLAAICLLTTSCSTGGTGTRDEGAAVNTPAERSGPTPRVTASSPAATTVEPVSLLRGDPKVSKRIKADLKPCSGDAYPVDTSYGDLTGGPAPDVVINVMTCDDSVGIATYVYRAKSDANSDANDSNDGPGAAEANSADGTNSRDDAGSSDGANDAKGSDSESRAAGAGSASGKSPARVASGADGTYQNIFATEEPAVYATIDRGELVVTQQVYGKRDPVSYPSGEDVVTYSWADSKFTERYRVHNDYSRAVGNGDVHAPAETAPSEN
ncbi:hypothetical protein [Streptomyces sp. NPDC088400]|uniref:hypothetical protein n=1 Tax=Streptomyces sp. NPDC088400 TaxID=3365861 RepID=UPI00380006ED